MDAQVVSIDTNIVKSEGEVQLLLERLKQLEDEMKSQSTHNVKVVEEIITIFELLKDHLELEQLIRELDSQLSRDPVNVIKRYFFALSQQVNENLAEAEKHLRFLVVLDYLNPYFQVDLGDVLRELGKVKEAEEAYQISHTLNPQLRNTVVAVCLSWAYLTEQQGKFDDAEKFFEKAVELDPSNISSRSTYGLLLHAEGKIDDALIQLKEAVRLGNHDSLVHATLGSLLRKNDNTLGEAEDHLRFAFRMVPDELTAETLAITIWDELILYDKHLTNLKKMKNDEERLMLETSLTNRRERFHKATLETRQDSERYPENIPLQWCLARLLCFMPTPMALNEAFTLCKTLIKKITKAEASGKIIGSGSMDWKREAKELLVIINDLRATILPDGDLTKSKQTKKQLQQQQQQPDGESKISFKKRGLIASRIFKFSRLILRKTDSVKTRTLATLIFQTISNPFLKENEVKSIIALGPDLKVWFSRLDKKRKKKKTPQELFLEEVGIYATKEEKQKQAQSQSQSSNKKQATTMGISSDRIRKPKKKYSSSEGEDFFEDEIDF